MSNHVHLIAVPLTPEALAQTLKHTHGRYASYWNGRRSSSGHVWQGRFYSCPLDDSHLWEALRYTELNPVRAGLVTTAERWPWSSAAAHCGTDIPGAILQMEAWRKRWTAPEWRTFLGAGESEADLHLLRRCTHTGRPLGTSDFVAALEKATLRLLVPQKGGRPKKSSTDPIQGPLIRNERMRWGTLSIAWATPRHRNNQLNAESAFRRSLR